MAPPQATRKRPVRAATALDARCNPINVHVGSHAVRREACGRI
jgi:hypothetical protein